ncbi:MAG: hypothetical protein M3Q89_09390, partial [Verrucomicrobiota bacterium]|nr:hypothetical protein [Verrucomicrobiota bacterium]
MCEGKGRSLPLARGPPRGRRSLRERRSHRLGIRSLTGAWLQIIEVLANGMLREYVGCHYLPMDCSAFVPEQKG